MADFSSEDPDVQQRRRMLLRTSSIDRRKQQLMMLEGMLEGANREGPAQRDLATKANGFTYRRSDPGPEMRSRGLAKSSSTGTHARGYLTAMSQSSPHSRPWRLEFSPSDPSASLAADGASEDRESGAGFRSRRPTLAQLKEVDEEGEATHSPTAETEGAATGTPFQCERAVAEVEAVEEVQEGRGVPQEEEQEEEQEGDGMEVEARQSPGAHRHSRPSGPSRLQRMTSAADDEVPSAASHSQLCGVGSSRLEQAAAAALATLAMEESGQDGVDSEAGEGRAGPKLQMRRAESCDTARGNPWAPLPGPCLDWVHAAAPASAATMRTCDSFRVPRSG